VFVADGDTIIIENLSRKQFKIRLEHIDAPESNQAYGEASKEFLYSLIFGKTVSVKTDKKDKYGRHIGVVFYGRTNVNLASIEAGMSWHTKDFSNNPQFAKAEEEARESMSGLWSDPDATPPWRYRKYQSRS
jgi:micrococcal nuclease